MNTKDLNNQFFYIMLTLMFIYFYILFYYIYYFILINEQISPSKDGLRAPAVYDLAEIIKKNFYLLNFLSNKFTLPGLFSVY
jgi:hypothetical protein